MTEVRLMLNENDSAKLEEIKTWLNESKDTTAFRILLTEKYQEIKKIKLGKGDNTGCSSKL